MVEHIDDAWTLSWAGNWWDHGVVSDEVFGDSYDSSGGSTLFGRTYVFVYGGVLELVGWTRSNAFWISTLFIISSAYIWKGLLLKIGYKPCVARWFPLVMLILEASFAASNKGRVDAMGFFLATLAFALFVNRRQFSSGFITILAMEVNPFAVVGFMYIVAYVVSCFLQSKKKFQVSYFKFNLYLKGVLAGLAYYLYFHYDYLKEAPLLVNRLSGSVLEAYFFYGRYHWRHWPEGVVVIIAIIFFIKNRTWITDRFIFPFIIMTTLVVYLMPHANPFYIIYLFPPYILLVIDQASKENLKNLIFGGLICLMIPQYSWLFWTQRNYDHDTYITELKKKVPAQPEVIYGHSNAWFAFNSSNRVFKASRYFLNSDLPFEKWPDEFLLVENKESYRQGGMFVLYKNKHHYEITIVEQWEYYDGSNVLLKHYKKKLEEPKI